jgi:uncharacterized protein YwgA
VYRWHIHFYGPYRHGEYTTKIQRLCSDGFTRLQFVGTTTNGIGGGYYATTHPRKSAMMMHMLKYTDDNIEILEEFHDV